MLDLHSQIAVAEMLQFWYPKSSFSSFVIWKDKGTKVH